MVLAHCYAVSRMSWLVAKAIVLLMCSECFFLCITIWLLGCGDRLPGHCYPAVIGGFKHITVWLV